MSTKLLLRKPTSKVKKTTYLHSLWPALRLHVDQYLRVQSGPGTHSIHAIIGLRQVHSFQQNLDKTIYTVGNHIWDTVLQYSTVTLTLPCTSPARIGRKFPPHCSQGSALAEARRLGRCGRGTFLRSSS